MTERIVTACKDCPFVIHQKEFPRLYCGCESPFKLDKPIHVDTPNWCPLKKESVLIKFEKE